MLVKAILYATAAATAARAAALPQIVTPGPPTTLTYTNYMGDASCHQNFPEQTMTLDRCTFIDFNDGVGTIRWGNMVHGSDCAGRPDVLLKAWRAESCAGQPAYTLNASALNYADCNTYLRGLSVMLSCPEPETETEPEA